jgi:hypothetical protein
VDGPPETLFPVPGSIAGGPPLISSISLRSPWLVSPLCYAILMWLTLTVSRYEPIPMRMEVNIMQRLSFASHPPRSRQATREVRRNTPLRQARTCYGHLAGVAGVDLLAVLVQRGWLKAATCTDETRPSYQLTPPGEGALTRLGVEIPDPKKTRRRFACIDWTERCPHLGGALGSAVLQAMVKAGIVQRQQNTRAVIMLHPLEDWFGMHDSAQIENSTCPRARDSRCFG